MIVSANISYQHCSRCYTLYIIHWQSSTFELVEYHATMAHIHQARPYVTMQDVRWSKWKDVQQILVSVLARPTCTLWCRV